MKKIEVIPLTVAGVTIVTLTGDNGLIGKTGEAKTATEKSVIKEEIKLLLIQAQAGDKLEDIFKDGTVTKDNAVYEVSYKGNDFLVSDDYEYIEKVEPVYEGEWTFNESTGTLTEYKGDLTTKRGNQEIGEVIIPNYYNGKRVKILKNRVFNKNINLTKLTISDGIEEIGFWSFMGCGNLKGDLIIPDSVISVGNAAFHNCGLDGKLKLSNNLQKIETNTFYYCTNIKGEVIIPESVTAIEGTPFAGCSSITSMKFLNKDTIINSVPPKAIIKGYGGSTAQEYATENGKTFELITP